MSKLPSEMKESVIRDYLAERLPQLREMIKNADVFSNKLKAAEQAFFNISSEDGGPTALDLLKRILAKRNLKGFAELYDLQLLGTEFPLLTHTGPGRPASADILALAPESGTFFILEIKKDVSTERQATGELSAYSLGLQQRFWGMNPTDQVWVPVSTKWSNPVQAAFAHQVFFAGRAVLPLQAAITLSDDKQAIANIDLELIDLAPGLDEALASSQFAWDCFDTLSIQLSTEPSDPRTIVDFIVGTASRLGYSGFVAYAVSPLENTFPYPYSFLIAAHNPIRGTLKRSQLEAILTNEENGGLHKMRCEVKKRIWSCWDIDLLDWENGVDEETTKQTVEQLKENGLNNEADEEYAKLTKRVSVADIAAASGNRMTHLFKELKTRVDVMGEYEIGYPNLHSIVHCNNPLYFPPIDYVGYFGLMEEAVYERLLYEYHNRTEVGDGPIIGDLGGDPIRRASSPTTWVDFMELMNWEHDRHIAYTDENEDD